jgi:pyruvate formate-lyase activating enzyme-like uncharacterized protein
MKTNNRRRVLKDKNRLEIGRYYSLLDWLDASTADRMNQERERILDTLEKQVDFGCNQTKLDVSDLSPGCELCAAGQWSCLFINGKCNANCFYCPSEQNEIGVPQSNGLEFPTPESWIAYIKKFKFRGLSLSGGEPFLTFDRSLSYLKAAKAAFGDTVHFWIYTNGLLATEEKMQMLADAGLDEIRFDIGATNYNLRFLKTAIGKIPTVTVEIPAVPEKFDVLKEKVREMAEIGVNHLNLHQLRMTAHNLPKFAERGYLLSHGEKVTVPESELTALKLIQYVKDNNIPLPINYCSFAFKNRYQHASGRYRIAKEIVEDYESLTPNGYIRSLAISGPSNLISETVKQLKSEIPGWKWYFERNSGRIFIHPDCLSYISFVGLDLLVSYHVTRMRRQHETLFASREVFLGNDERIFVQRRPACSEILLSGEEIEVFMGVISNHSKKIFTNLVDKEFWYEIVNHEFIPFALPDYF